MDLHTSVALGTMNFGKRTSAAESERIMLRALERGITLFDTANVYNDGESERIVGRCLRSRRDSVQIATKVGFGRVAGHPEGLSTARVLSAIDASLGRLGTDYVDVYYLHVPDHATPIAETLDAMQVVLDQKKARSWGVSNYASWQILEMNILADARRMPRPVMSQVLYNVLIRQLDVEYFKFARKHPIHTTVYNPLAGGLLAGKHAQADVPPAHTRFDGNALYQKRYWTRTMFDHVKALAAIASEEGISVLELAYAWLAQREGVDSIPRRARERRPPRRGARGVRQAALAGGVHAHRRPLRRGPGDERDLREMSVQAHRTGGDLDLEAIVRLPAGTATRGSACSRAPRSSRRPARARRRDHARRGRIPGPLLPARHVIGALRRPRIRHGVAGAVARVSQDREAREGPALPRVARSSRSSKRVARAVYGPEPLAIYRALLMTKGAGGGTVLPWHQDAGRFWGIDRDPELQLWTALDDAPEEAGCVEVLPGTHREGS